MFKNIFYEPWKGKMHLWELNDNGETEYKTFDHKIEYYVKDRSGKSEIKSIDGLPVIKQETTNRDIIKQLKASGERIFERTISLFFSKDSFHFLTEILTPSVGFLFLKKRSATRAPKTNKRAITPQKPRAN